MSNPVSGDQDKVRSGGGRQGRLVMSGDAPDRASGAGHNASQPVSRRPEDDDERTTPVGGRQYWRFPIDLDLLY